MDDHRSRPSETVDFARLAMPHRTAAFNLAYWMLGNREEAEDVVQEAYLRGFRAFAGVKGEDIRPWLLMIVRNAALTALKSKRRTNNVILLSEDVWASTGNKAEEVPATTPTPEALVIAESERQQVMAALAKLPLKYREVIVLREMEGLSYLEIAETTGTAIGTVMSRLSRGRAELRRTLELSLHRHEQNAV
jgi:RNA polymerase sigma-70 factor, ECF subfamily